MKVVCRGGWRWGKLRMLLRLVFEKLPPAALRGHSHQHLKVVEGGQLTLFTTATTSGVVRSGGLCFGGGGVSMGTNDPGVGRVGRRLEIGLVGDFTEGLPDKT